MNHRYRSARILISAARVTQLPPDEGIEIAFAGRSNAGKSSALNAIAGQKGLARTSKTPGRTQLINLFALDDHRRLVDLPGYGYAKVPEAVKLQWQKSLNIYLETRHALRGLILVMDIRHPFRPFDEQVLGWCLRSQLAVHILLTKADKLKQGAALNTLRTVCKRLEHEYAGASAQLFSASKREGIDEAHVMLDRWFEWDICEEQGDV